jgi:hypothetical protein
MHLLRQQLVVNEVRSLALALAHGSAALLSPSHVAPDYQCRERTVSKRDEEWVDGDRCDQISAAMREAWEAMDRAYYHSHTDGDLIENTTAVSAALAKVRRHARANQ